jgi:hypothetical protein
MYFPAKSIIFKIKISSTVDKVQNSITNDSRRGVFNGPSLQSNCRFQQWNRAHAMVFRHGSPIVSSIPALLMFYGQGHKA